MPVSRSRTAVIAIAIVGIITALSATSAQASKFQAGEYTATVSGSQVLGEEMIFTFGKTPGLARCVTFSLVGTLAAAAETITLHPTFKGTCVVFGSSAGTSITTTGCDFKLHSGALLAGTTYEGTADIVCSVGNSIKIVGDTCEIEIKSVNNLAKVELVNQAGPPADLTTKFKLTSLPYTVNTDGATCPLPGTGNFTDGVYMGNSTLTAVGPGGPTGFFVK